MIRRALILILFGAGLGQGFAVEGWDYRPIVTYVDETVQAMWRPAAGSPAWHVDSGTSIRVSADNGVVTCNWLPQQDPVLVLHGPAGKSQCIRAIQPGAAAGMTWSADQELRQGDDLVVLALSRIEARSDRRWWIVRALGGEHPRPCADRLGPQKVPEGKSALLSQCAQAQDLHPAGQGVLVEIAAGERFVGWKHREFRQVLAWLVADLQARQAGFVVLVQPRAAAVVDAELEPLRQQIIDVANAYRCRLMDPESLRDARYWTIFSGILGTTLNADGQAERGRVLAPWLGP